MQAGTETTFTLDVAGRRLTQRTTSTDAAVGSSTIVRHYTDGTDNPAWTATTPDGGTPAITRYAESLAGDLGAQLDQDGAVCVSLATLHGDVATTITIPADQSATTPAVSIGGWSDYTEYGAPRDPAATNAIAGPAGYGWLGAKQRSTTPATASLTLMGDRYYNPTRGLFTSLDPEPGGNPTACTYPLDPINGYDLDGHRWEVGGLGGGGGGSSYGGSFDLYEYIYQNRRSLTVDAALFFVLGGVLFRGARWAARGARAGLKVATPAIKKFGVG